MPDGAAPRLLTHFSTADLPERDRLPMWREEFGRGIVRVDIQPLDPEGFQAEATLRAFPGLRTVSFSGSSMLFDRTPALAAQGNDDVGLVIGLGAQTVTAQRSQEATLAEGDAFPILTDQPASVAGARHVGLLVPRSALLSRLPDLALSNLRKVSRSSTPLRLLISYLSALPPDMTVAGQDEHFSHLSEFVPLKPAKPGAVHPGARHA